MALTTAADLLHRFCVVTRIRCSADTQIITEELIPLLVHELETAQSSSDRLTAILALGTLAVDDVLLLLVPYIRGEDAVTRIAAIFSLQRLMDSSSEKVNSFFFCFFFSVFSYFFNIFQIGMELNVSGDPSVEFAGG